MTTHFKYICCLLTCLTMLACTTEPPQEPSMVLEGWIDAGGFPVVLLHKSYVMDKTTYQRHTLDEVIEEQLLPWSKVTVSDGENEEILTGRMDTLYMPPYTYSTINLRGEIGKTYTVTAKYKEMYVTATTTIPPVATLDSLRIFSDNNNKKYVSAYIHRTDYNAYYALFLRYIDGKQFMFCPSGVLDSRQLTGSSLEMMVYNPLTNDSTLAPSMLSNFDTDTVNTYQLKVARLDEESYRFWDAFDRLNSTKGVAFVPVVENLIGNVQGGVGNFTGLGSSVYTFRTHTDTTYYYQ